MKNLEKLETLYAANNNIKDISVLKHLPELKYELYLENNIIEDISVFSEMTNTELSAIDLSGNKVKDITVFTDIQWSPGILYLADNEIEDISCLSELIERDSLLWLDVSGNKIIDISPVASILEKENGRLFAEDQQITLPAIIMNDKMELSFDSKVIGIDGIHTTIDDFSISPQGYYKNGTIIMMELAVGDFDVTYSFEEIYGGTTIYVPLEYGEGFSTSYYRNFSFTGTVTQPCIYEDILSMPDDNAPAELISTDGIIVTGTFPEGTELITKLVTSGQAYDLLSTQLKENNTTYFVYDISLQKSGTIIQPDSEVQVSIPISIEYGSESKVYRLEDDNSITLLDTTANNGYITFSTEHFSYYGIGDGLLPESSQGNENNTGNDNNGNTGNNSGNENTYGNGANSGNANVSGNNTGNTTNNSSNSTGTTQTNDTTATSSAPATGDTNTMIPFLLCLLAAFAVIGALYQRKRHHTIVQ